METLNNIVLTIQDYMSNIVLIIALAAAGIWFSVRTGFIQVRGFKRGIKQVFGGLFSKKGEAGNDGMSSFQALATAIAAQVGTGNIAGSATAIAIGGPGAIFWMWVAAFLGMATIYSEALMAQRYKKIGDDGIVTGGPVYYIRGAFKGAFGKVLAGIFAVLLIFALGFMGNAVQSNSIAASFHTAFGIPQWIMGLIVAVLAVFIFSGGMKRIAKVTETMVPLMAALYILGSLIVIFYNWRNIPLAFYEIFVGAFAPASIAGGAVGATIKLAITKGVARGLFSNEAGMGSTPHAHAVAKVAHPVLTMTALVIVTTRALPESYNVVEGGYTGAELSQFAYSLVYGKFGEIFIAICMFFFAFSTIVGWYFFGQANIKYLFGSKAVPVYSVLVCVCVFLGSLAQVDLVWNMADCFNSLMVVPNIIGLLALSGMVKKVHDDYFNNFLKGKPSEFSTKND